MVKIIAYTLNALVGDASKQEEGSRTTHPTTALLNNGDVYLVDSVSKHTRAVKLYLPSQLHCYSMETRALVHNASWHVERSEVYIESFILVPKLHV